MNTVVGWVLAVMAVAAGYVGYGWRGVALALTAVVFWLLLQFSRSLRVLQKAASQPVGSVANAVMLYAKVQPGMRLPQILALTHSLGRQVAQDPETFVWRDEAGDEVNVVLRDGQVTERTLVRAADAAS